MDEMAKAFPFCKHFEYKEEEEKEEDKEIIEI